MIPAADGVYPTDEAARTAQTISTLQGMLMVVAVITVLIVALYAMRGRDRRHDNASTLVPMQSQEWVNPGQFAHRTDDVADAAIRAYDAETMAAEARALNEMHARQIRQEKWDAQQEAYRRLKAQPVRATPDVAKLEAFVAGRPGPKELGR